MSAPETTKGPSIEHALATIKALAGIVLKPSRPVSRRVDPGPGAAGSPTRASAVVVVDADEHIHSFNAEAERLWGRSASDVLRSPLNDLLDLPRLGAMDPMLATARRLDGSRVPVLVSRSPLTLDGQTVSILVVRSSHEEAEATRAGELRYRSLVEQIPAVVFTAVLDGGLTDLYVGPQIEALLGYTQEEWLGSPVLWYYRLHPDDRRTLDQEFARGCATGGQFRAECRFIAKDGHIVWVHGEARFIRDADGRPLMLQGVAFDITESKRAEEVVRASLREKELLLKEIHHRVKNNLQITSSLLHLQFAKLTDESARLVLRESQNRIRSMALVHEMLYRSPDLSRVDFSLYVKELLLQLFRAYGVDTQRISYTLDIRDAALGVDVAIPCGLLVNELVMNSLKHAFPEGRKGSVQIRMSREDALYRLDVSDDGIGFPDGADFRRTKTLGLQLVRTLVDQISGTIAISGGKDRGTEFHITFRETGAPT